MGTVNTGLFTSTTDEWPTPRDLFDTLDAEFQFNLDPCADSSNAKCERSYTKEDDGLSQQWTGTVFMNPPYGRAMKDWVRKAYEESAFNGATVVCLIPARTDTAYWHDYVMKASEIRFIRSRLHFSNARHEGRKASGLASAHNAPFPSVVIVFRGESAGTPLVSAINRDGSRIEVAA